MERIPSVKEPEKFVKSAFAEEEFVRIRSDERFEVCMQYPLQRMKNAEEECFLRKEVYERLLAAAKELPGGYRIKILDAWRPFALQKELYEVYSGGILSKFRLESASEEEQSACIRKFVSEPLPDRDLPPVHTTGGAVDITLLDDHGRELDMGTDFDAFAEETHTAYFENLSSGEEKDETMCLIRDNRRLLYHTMIRAGFTNLPSEWWHFDYGDRFWAYYRKQPAIYRGVFTKEELRSADE